MTDRFLLEQVNNLARKVIGESDCGRSVSSITSLVISFIFTFSTIEKFAASHRTELRHLFLQPNLRRRMLHVPLNAIELHN